MKPIELHLYLPFSYWRDRDAETGVRLLRPDAQSVAGYLRALSQELGGMQGDFQDCEVSAIRFRGGYLSLLDAEDLNRLLSLNRLLNRFVHRKWLLLKNPAIRLVLPTV